MLAGAVVLAFFFTVAGIVIVALRARELYARALRLEADPVVRAPIVARAQFDRIDRSIAEMEALRDRARAALTRIETQVLSIGLLVARLRDVVRAISAGRTAAKAALALWPSLLRILGS